jgi:hypothetical protein
MNKVESSMQIAAVQAIEHLFTIRWPEWVMELEDSKKRRYKSSPLHAVPNGGNRNIVTAVTQKREGQKPGVWDLVLEIPMGGYSGLRIENKRPEFRNRKNGGLSFNQLAWGEHYRKVGYKTVVCYHTLEITDAVIEYMDAT